MLTQELRERLSHSRAALLTAIGVSKQGFFVPYPYADEVAREIPEYCALTDLLRGHDRDFLDLLDGVGSRIDAFRAIGDGPEDPPWQGGMFSPRDGVVAYEIVRRHRPRRILEIGSGNSTRFLVRGVRDAGIDCRITCIDPLPRVDIAALQVTHESRVLRVEDKALVEELEAGDALFIDSSHIMLPGMDVDIQFNVFFPALAPGVLVHVHDIFLPFAYPAGWNAHRQYSEQNALFGWIYSGFFEVLFAGHYVSRIHGAAWARLAAAFAPFANDAAASIWLRRR